MRRARVGKARQFVLQYSKIKGRAPGSAVKLACDLLATTHPSKGDCANVPT